MLSASSFGKENSLTPGESINSPPKGKSYSVVELVVCRPWRLRSDISCVSISRLGTSALIRVDLPTPDCPTNMQVLFFNCFVNASKL